MNRVMYSPLPEPLPPLGVAGKLLSGALPTNLLILEDIVLKIKSAEQILKRILRSNGRHFCVALDARR